MNDGSRVKYDGSRTMPIPEPTPWRYLSAWKYFFKLSKKWISGISRRALHKGQVSKSTGFTLDMTPSDPTFPLSLDLHWATLPAP